MTRKLHFTCKITGVLLMNMGINKYLVQSKDSHASHSSAQKFDMNSCWICFLQLSATVFSACYRFYIYLYTAHLLIFHLYHLFIEPQSGLSFPVIIMDHIFVGLHSWNVGNNNLLHRKTAALRIRVDTKVKVEVGQTVFCKSLPSSPSFSVLSLISPDFSY